MLCSQFGLFSQPKHGELYNAEWSWALRGGGAQLVDYRENELSELDAQTALLVVDNAALTSVAKDTLTDWVAKGGILIVSGAEAALKQPVEKGDWQDGRNFMLSDLLGTDFAGYDNGLIGTYPAVIADSDVLAPLLAPLQKGDALRFGKKGVGHGIKVNASDAKVLARSAWLSAGGQGLVQHSSTPTILTRQHGLGRVVFLTFSLAEIALCYPDADDNMAATDCSGASQAHALMRWLVANLLWQEKKLQLPLLWEAPGHKPHAVVITGDVHLNAREVDASVKMAQSFADQNIPLSLYLVGEIVNEYPAQYARLQQFDDLEISPHSANGRVYWTKRFRYTRKLGIYLDFKKAQKLLDVDKYPEQRDWLISVRNESSASDENAWDVMRKAGVGLVFDHISDAIENRDLYLAPRALFIARAHERLFVPIFEHSISTPVDDFRLSESDAQDIALLTFAQAEPCCIPLSYKAYTQYVEGWHSIFSRLAINGGLTEAWLWHPGGVASKKGFALMRQTLANMKEDPTVPMLRADAVATWRFNRDNNSIAVTRDAKTSRILAVDLRAPKKAAKPLPPNAPSLAGTTSYWVLGELQVPGWQSHVWHDAQDRPVTVLVRPLQLPESRQ